MALAEKRICEHTDATTISSADEFIVDSMANGTRNITMTNLESQILSTDTYSALTGIGDGTITGSIVDIDSNLNNLTYDSTTNRLTMTGNTAFSGTIDSSPTAGSGNAVSSGGTKTYVDSAVSELNAEIDALTSYSKQTLTTTDYPLLDANIIIIRFGKVVSILFRGFKNLTANTEITIISALPVEFRPSEQVHYTVFQGGNSAAMARISISTGGVVKLYPYGDAAVSGSRNMNGTFTYVI